ncbi:MAG: hypothetical protein ACWGN7_04080 [Thermodesulfovibrionales bacterium]
MRTIPTDRHPTQGFAVAAATVAVLVRLLATGGEHHQPWSVTEAYAENARDDQSPYGGSGGGTYGEKRAVATKEEAEKVLKGYFGKKQVRIGKITEKELYFEAEILDSGNTLIDKVIVNKRTGRIRSIF